MDLGVVLIEARDLNEAWWLAIRKVLSHGYEYVIDAGSYEGSKRKEFDLVVIKITKPSTRPLVPLVPEGAEAPTTIEYVEKNYLPYLMTSVKGANEIYTYGEDIEPQFLEICRQYKEDGFENNRCCMSIGSSNSVFLEHSQCLRLIDTRVRYGKLHYIVYFRSWDLYSGMPVNLAGIQLMKEAMAEEIGVEDGNLIAISKGLHLYDHFWDLGKKVVKL